MCNFECFINDLRIQKANRLSLTVCVTNFSGLSVIVLVHRNDGWRRSSTSEKAPLSWHGSASSSFAFFSSTDYDQLFLLVAAQVPFFYWIIFWQHSPSVGQSSNKNESHWKVFQSGGFKEGDWFGTGVFSHLHRGRRPVDVEIWLLQLHMFSGVVLQLMVARCIIHIYFCSFTVAQERGFVAIYCFGRVFRVFLQNWSMCNNYATKEFS